MNKECHMEWQQILTNKPAFHRTVKGLATSQNLHIIPQDTKQRITRKKKLAYDLTKTLARQNGYNQLNKVTITDVRKQKWQQHHREMKSNNKNYGKIVITKITLRETYFTANESKKCIAKGNIFHSHWQHITPHQEWSNQIRDSPRHSPITGNPTQTTNTAP